MRKCYSGEQFADFRTAQFTYDICVQGKAPYKQTLGDEGSVEVVLPMSNAYLPITLQ